MTKIVAYKAFDKNLKCRDFQYEVGKSYEIEGEIEACTRGFHACEYPLDVLSYYPPDSRFAVVELDGETHTHGDDTKIAAAKITITAELQINELVQAAVKWILDRAKSGGKSSESEDFSAATNTGYRSAATNTGEHGAAMASGYQGRVMGSAGNALFLVERNDEYEIVNVWSGIVGKDGMEAGKYYMLADGNPVEVEG